MNMNLLLRRLHLYLGLVLLPFFLMYGVSSIAFSHPSWFQSSAGPKADWITRSEKNYTPDIEPGTPDRALGARILKDAGLDGAYGVWRPPGQKRIEVIQFGFLAASRAVYHYEANKLAVEDRRFRVGPFLGGMHARGGFEQDRFLNDFWAVMIDLISLSMFAWIGTGIYLWWKRKPSRTWGWVTIASSWVVFAVFLYLL